MSVFEQRERFLAQKTALIEALLYINVTSLIKYQPAVLTVDSL